MFIRDPLTRWIVSLCWDLLCQPAAGSALLSSAQTPQATNMGPHEQ